MTNSINIPSPVSVMVITTHDGLSVGDIITAYHAGYHLVTGFHEYAYGEHQILVDYVRVLNSKGKTTPKVHNHCHPSFCQKVDFKFVYDQRDEEINKAIEKSDTLEKLLKAEP